MVNPESAATAPQNSTDVGLSILIFVCILCVLCLGTLFLK